VRRLVLLAMLVAGGTLCLAATVPSQRQRGALEVERVRENLYVLRGGGGQYRGQAIAAGGNTSVYVADSGVVVVDTKFAGWGQEILDTIRTITSKPVTTIINTHTHLDHTGSNAEFPATVDIVTHENTRINLSQPACEEVTNCRAFTGERARFLPKRTFTDRLSLLGGRDRIDLYYFGAGHTNGDAMVVFREARVLATGDLFVRKSLPAVFRNDGGSPVALVQTLSKALTGIAGVDTVITGHSTTVTWRELEEYAAFNRDALAIVRAARESGRPAAEAATRLKSLETRYDGYTITPESAANHAEMIYAEPAAK
jgi:glyoxylase-like metal-dependent hydrolase (beta-lactamase superfamily II)